MTDYEQKQFDQLTYGDSTGWFIFGTQEEFDTAKAEQARTKGIEWIKNTFGEESPSSDDLDEMVEQFKTSGNGMLVYSKVHTLFDGTIIAKI